MPKEAKERAQVPSNSQAGFLREFKLSRGHSQAHLEVVYDRGWGGENDGCLILGLAPHPLPWPQVAVPQRDHLNISAGSTGPTPWALTCRRQGAMRTSDRLIQLWVRFGESRPSDVGNTHQLSVRCRGFTVCGRSWVSQRSLRYSGRKAPPVNSSI